MASTAIIFHHGGAQDEIDELAGKIHELRFGHADHALDITDLFGMTSRLEMRVDKLEKEKATSIKTLVKTAAGRTSTGIKFVVKGVTKFILKGVKFVTTNILCRDCWKSEVIEYEELELIDLNRTTPLMWRCEWPSYQTMNLIEGYFDNDDTTDEESDDSTKYFDIDDTDGDESEEEKAAEVDPAVLRERRELEREVRDAHNARNAASP